LVNLARAQWSAERDARGLARDSATGGRGSRSLRSWTGCRAGSSRKPPQPCRQALSCVPLNTHNVVNCGQRSQRRSTACGAAVGTTSPTSAVLQVTRSGVVGANTPRSARLVGGRGRPSQ
jgi:hypothetical protein